VRRRQAAMIVTPPKETQRDSTAKGTSMTESVKSRLKDVPGDSGWPILGHTWELVRGRSISSIFEENRAKHGDIFKLKLLNLDPSLPVVVVHNDEITKRLLLEENVTVNSAWPRDVLDLLGKKGALLRYTGDEHLQVRKVIVEGLCKKTVDQYSFAIIERIVQRYLDKWVAMKTVPIFSETRALACEVAASASLGIEFDDATFQRLRVLFDDISTGIFMPKGIPKVGDLYAQAEQSRAEMAVLLEPFIIEFLDSYKRGEAPEGVLGLVIRASEEEALELDTEFLVGFVVNMLFGGMETTAFALMKVFGELERQPELLNSLKKEQDEIMAEFGEELTPTVVRSMPLLDGLIKELLRLMPPVSSVFRRALVDLDVGGYYVPKGTMLFLQIGETSANVFDGEFDARRWLNVECIPDAYMPFGLGRRVCPGRDVVTTELKIAVLQAVRRMRWQCLYLPEALPLNPQAVGGFEGPKLGDLQMEFVNRHEGFAVAQSTEANAAALMSERVSELQDSASENDVSTSGKCPLRNAGPVSTLMDVWRDDSRAGKIELVDYGGAVLVLAGVVSLFVLSAAQADSTNSVFSPGIALQQALIGLTEHHVSWAEDIFLAGVVGSTFYALHKMLDVKRKSVTALTDFHMWTGALAFLSTLYAIGLERCFRTEPGVQWALISSLLYIANAVSWFPLLRIFKGNEEQKMAFNLAYSFVVSFQGIQMIALCADPEVSSWAYWAVMPFWWWSLRKLGESTDFVVGLLPSETVKALPAVAHDAWEASRSRVKGIKRDIPTISYVSLNMAAALFDNAYMALFTFLGPDAFWHVSRMFNPNDYHLRMIKPAAGSLTVSVLVFLSTLAFRRVVPWRVIIWLNVVLGSIGPWFVLFWHKVLDYDELWFPELCLAWGCPDQVVAQLPV